MSQKFENVLKYIFHNKKCEILSSGFNEEDVFIHVFLGYLVSQAYPILSKKKLGTFMLRIRDIDKLYEDWFWESRRFDNKDYILNLRDKAITSEKQLPILIRKDKKVVLSHWIKVFFLEGINILEYLYIFYVSYSRDFFSLNDVKRAIRIVEKEINIKFLSENWNYLINLEENHVLNHGFKNSKELGFY